MISKSVSLFALVNLLFLAGCASNISPATYSVGSVGQVNRTIAATIISARAVDIDGSSGAGAATGAGLGAVAGSGAGGSGRANVAGAIGGGVIGTLVGSAIEQSATRQTGIEYVVQTDNNNLMTVVQGSNPSFSIGDKVLVLYGSPSRIILDPRK